MTDIFAAPTGNATPTPDPTDLENWIGPGKKYADTDSALRALPHAQAHIKTLQQELDEARAQLEAAKSQTSSAPAKTAADVAAEIATQNVAPKPAPVQDPNSAGQEVDIAALVRQEIQKQVSVAQADTNLTAAHTQLLALHGNDAAKAQQALAETAKEHGLTVADLKALGERSPKALLRFFEKKEAPTADPVVNPTPAHGAGSNAPAPESLTPGTEKYYQNMRRKNPAQYYSGPIQQQRMNDRIRLGEDFYK